MRFDKKILSVFANFVLFIGHTATRLHVTSRERKIIANYVRNRAYLARGMKEAEKCYDVTYRGGREEGRIRMRRGFSKVSTASHGG